MGAAGGLASNVGPMVKRKNTIAAGDLHDGAHGRVAASDVHVNSHCV
jgi:hypothetical protein